MGFFDRLRAGSQRWAETLAVVPPAAHLQNVGLVPARPGVVHGREEDTIQQDIIKIRVAYDASRAAAARVLVERRYEQKGYFSVGDPNNRPVVCPENITLATYKGEEMMGTLSIDFDTGAGLLVDEIYNAEVGQLRSAGRRVCEFTSLAIDNKRTSKRMLAGLFHIAFMYAERIWQYTDILIEVNPSHVPFYVRMLGFEVLGSERMCARVNAPAVLLRIETSWVRQKVREFGGRAELAKLERTLYPYFLPQAEEDRILERLLRG